MYIDEVGFKILRMVSPYTQNPKPNTFYLAPVNKQTPRHW